MAKRVRTLATSVTTTGFILVGVSGVMLYFHLFEASVKQMHELLGLLFVAGAVVHVAVNWKQMKGYFSRKTFLGVAAAGLLVAAGFVTNASVAGDDPKKTVIVSVLKAPLEQSLPLLGVEKAAFKKKLTQNGIYLNNSTTIEQIAKKNGTSPFHVVSVATKG